VLKTFPCVVCPDTSAGYALCQICGSNFLRYSLNTFPHTTQPWTMIPLEWYSEDQAYFFLVRLLLTIGTEITLIYSEHPWSTNFQVNIHVCYALETAQSMCVLQLFYHPSYLWHNWSPSLWCGVYSILYSHKKQLFASFISSFLLIYIQVIITTCKLINYIIAFNP